MAESDAIIQQQEQISSSKSPLPSKMSMISKIDSTMNCSVNSSLCSKDLNLVCDQSSGECQCAPETPVRLSEEIPCIRYKRLGELCIHTSECSSTKHSSCVATFLFSMKVLSKTPSYKQWFFYNKIHNDDDMNYLLNKLYGRCRCQKGFRALKTFECTYAGTEAPFRCHHETDCFSFNARCHQDRCVCSHGYHYDITKGYCDEIINLHGEFCASSSDCFSQYSNMECKNSACTCTRNYLFHNRTGCIRKDICHEGMIWNSTTRTCQSSSFATLTICALVIKSFPFILIIIIIFNLICYFRQRKSSNNHQLEVNDLSRRYTLTDYEGSLSQSSSSNNNNNNNNIQSYSLLSLPDYETVFNGTSAASTLLNSEERLPTYEEAIESLKFCDCHQPNCAGGHHHHHHQHPHDSNDDNLLQKGNL